MQGRSSSKESSLNMSEPLLSSSSLGVGGHDVDDDKYKRKSAVEMMLRWFKTFGPGSRRRTSKTQRC